MLQKLTGKTVSLMCNGCSRWGTKYQGFVIYTYQKLYFFFSVWYSRNVTVVSICTDQAESNVSALNIDEKSAQEISGECFIQQPFATHTANLVLKDGVEFYHIKLYQCNLSYHTNLIK